VPVLPQIEETFIGSDALIIDINDVLAFDATAWANDFALGNRTA